MTLEKQEFFKRYIELMLEYAKSFDEAPLLAIEELGHEMVQSDIPPEDIGEMHDAAIAELMTSSELSSERVRAASLPLMQLLMAYGIAFREVRARQEIEQALLESEKQYHTLFESSRDAIMILDGNGFITGNQAAIRMFGCHSLDDFKGKHPSELSPPTQPCGKDSLTMANKRIAMALRDGSVQFEWMHKKIDGAVFPAEVLLAELELDGKKVLQGTVRDITERKKAEEALQSLSTTFAAVSGESFFRNVVSHLATTLGMDYAIIGELIGGKDRINVVGGYAKGQAMELPFQYDLANSPCENVVGQAFCICPSGVQKQFPKDTLLADLGVDGYMGSPLFDSAGQPLGIIALMHSQPIKNPEIAEALFKIFSVRVSAEIERAQADESVRKLSSAIEHAGESILITDRNGVIEYVNPSFTRITGYSAEEAIGQTPRLLNSGNQDEAFYADMWKTITAGKVWHGKVIDRRKDGSFYPAMLTISPIFDASGKATHYTHFIGIQSDLSKLEDMEARFHQAQKMEAIGTMVGGIAHNFNNMLAGMAGNVYLAKKKVKKLPDVLKRLEKIEEISFLAADMISQLLAFARKDMISMKEMELSSFINETLKLLHTSIPENIMVHRNISSKPMQIKGDATQLHQVAINLINNARDAVEGVDAPCITISLDAFHVDKAFIRKHPYFKAGDYAHLSVEDNGCGIPERQIEHLFEPFFTTKEQGVGTGLGLSMVFGSITNHQGFVEVDSIQGKGSSFHVYIPLLEAAADVSESTKKQSIAEGRSELILLVDDELMIRETMGEVLESMGYRVLKAEDGLAAIEIFKEHLQEISLALVDVVMPRCGGMLLAKKIRAISSDMPIIFLTGYDGDHVLQGDEQIPNSGILTKPVPFDVLNHLIRQLLG